MSLATHRECLFGHPGKLPAGQSSGNIALPLTHSVPLPVSPDLFFRLIEAKITWLLTKT